MAGGAQVAGAAPGTQQAPIKDRERRRDRDKNKDKDKEGMLGYCGAAYAERL